MNQYEQSIKLSRVIELSMDAVVVSDERGGIIEWNPKAEDIFGWTNKEAMGRKVSDLIIPEEHRQAHDVGVRNIIKADVDSHQSKHIQTRAMHRDGHIISVDLVMSSAKLNKSWIFIACIRDLTEKNAHDQAFTKKEVLLQGAQSIAKLGYWELDVKEKTLEWSDEVFHIFQIDRQTTKPLYEIFKQSIHPGDIERVDGAYKASLKSKVPYEIIHRLLLNDGSIKFVQEQCRTYFDKNNMAINSVGVVQDITERINTSEELRLAATTFNTHAGIMITARDSTIIRVNPAFEKMTGYKASEILGMKPNILQSGLQDEKFYKAMWHDIKTTGCWQGELWNKRKDGSLYAEGLTITAVKNEEGEVVNYVGTSQDITERKKAEAHIEHLAYHDDLTDLSNRRLLLDRLQKDLAISKRHNTYGALLLLDIDRFKDLNDSLGHPVGDHLLKQVAERLRKLVREADVLARLGGDEFVVLIPPISTELLNVSFDANRVAEKIRKKLAEPYRLNNSRHYMTVSIGVVIFPEHEKHSDDVLKHADNALYRAKGEGRDSICFYQPKMQEIADKRLVIEKGLRYAIENNELLLHYQSQLSSDGRLSGAEALVRWQHPDKGMISPAAFIPVAEESGLILDVGVWVLKEAARQMQKWINQGVFQPGQRLSVNVSPRQFHQEEFVEQLLKTFEHISPEFIELEITENLMMDNQAAAIEKIHLLRNYGFHFAIDDFGTGYSSLSYLSQLPLDKLKIDRSFITHILEDKKNAAIVESIIAIAMHMDISVIAEGVETLEQAEFLADKGCHLYQGYYFSRPVSSSEYLKYVANQSGRTNGC